MTELDILRTIQTDLAEMRSELATLSKHVGDQDRLLNILQQDTREIRSALNDMARTNLTPREVEALHSDANRLQQGIAELEGRVDVIEQSQR
jgi:hypothetical protein